MTGRWRQVVAQNKKKYQNITRASTSDARENISSHGRSSMRGNTKVLSVQRKQDPTPRVLHQAQGRGDLPGQEHALSESNKFPEEHPDSWPDTEKA
jgi:hypothetical protein